MGEQKLQQAPKEEDERLGEESREWRSRGAKS